MIRVQKGSSLLMHTMLSALSLKEDPWSWSDHPERLAKLSLTGHSSRCRSGGF